jgi:hypothetical protein
MPNRAFTNYFEEDFKDLSIYKDSITGVVRDDVLPDQFNVQFGLPDPVDGQITLSGAYFIAGTVNIASNEIVLDGDTQLIGLNERTDLLVYTGSGTAITGNGHSFSTKFVSFSTPSGKVFDLTGTSEKFVYMLSNGFFNCASIGDFETFRFVAIKLARINGSGSIRFDGAIGKALVSDTPFEQATATEIIYGATFDGGAEVKGNWFFDGGGGHIEFEDVGLNQQAAITGNRFTQADEPNFIGFNESTVGFIVEDNIGQINSGSFLDASFSGNETPITVGTDWMDINVDYSINYTQRFTYNEADKSFTYLGVRDSLLRAMVQLFAESGGNNQDFEFGLFVDNGDGFELAEPVVPYRFRQADNTSFISVGARLVIEAGARFTLRVRKPGGSSGITFLSSKVLV